MSIERDIILDLPGLLKQAETYYHGSPRADLQELNAGSYVTPDYEIARVMGRHHLDTGKTWSDEDLDEKHWMGKDWKDPKWKDGREPLGEPTIYSAELLAAALDLLDNPYEHRVRDKTTVKQARPLDDLLAAKKESDRRNYPAKHDILRKLIKQSPGDFMIDSEEGNIYGVTHIPTGFRIHMPRSEAPSGLQKMPTQDDIFEKVRKYLPADAQHASGGMPDVNGVSDVDVSVYHPDPAKALELLPKGTTVRSQKDNAVEYAVPGYRRDVNVYVTSDPDVAQQSVDHRRTTRALKDKFPDAYQVAEALKRQGLGTEPAWAQALDVKGDPYKAMRDTDAMLAAGDDDVYVQSAIPSSALAMVRKHGLLSSEALLSNPESMAALLAAHKDNPTAAGAKGKRSVTDEKVWRKRVEDNLKDDFWAPAMQGPSVFFGEPDPDKITDEHPTRRFPHQTVRVNLSKILRDQPKTRIAGSELHPYDPEGPDDQGRHRDIDLAQVREYAATDPKEMWKNYNSPGGTHYASDVPHAMIITPSGSIAPEYLDFGDAPKPVLKQAGRTIKDLDLSEYLKGYELNDPGHGPQHAENVRRTAAGLSGIHAPGREHLVDYAAALHDMDVHGGREDHENRAADTIANAPYFQENLSKRDLRTVSEAVRQHRSSTGRPRTTVAKIVSDADRLAEIDPAAALQRAVSWGQQHDPALTEDEQILRAHAHLVEKYGPGGKARRLYYPESLPQLEEKINPIISTEGDIDKLKALLQEKQALDREIILDLPGLLKKAYLQGAPLAPTGNKTLRMLTANTPVEPYAQNFSSVGEYADELPGALITRPSEGPLWKGDIGSTVKSVLKRPLARREEATRHARSFRMIQAAIAKREGIDSRNQAWSTAMQNQPTTTTDSPWGAQQTGPVGAPQRPQAQGQGAAWDGRTGWFYDLMSRNPDEFELNSSTGNESTWVHKPTGMQYTVPDAPSPSTRFSVHTEQPNFDEWANAMRWRQGKPARG